MLKVLANIRHRDVTVAATLAVRGSFQPDIERDIIRVVTRYLRNALKISVGLPLLSLKSAEAAGELRGLIESVGDNALRVAEEDLLEGPMAIAAGYPVGVDGSEIHQNKGLVNLKDDILDRAYRRLFVEGD